MEGLREYLEAGSGEQKEVVLVAEQAAMDLLHKRRRKKDGFWPVQNRHPGREFFQMEKTGGPSRWNTLRVLRVLRWWEG